MNRIFVDTEERLQEIKKKLEERKEKRKRIYGGNFVKKEKRNKCWLYIFLIGLIVINILNLLFDKVTMFRCFSFSLEVILVIVPIVYYDN